MQDLKWIKNHRQEACALSPEVYEAGKATAMAEDKTVLWVTHNKSRATWLALRSEGDFEDAALALHGPERRSSWCSSRPSALTARHI